MTLGERKYGARERERERERERYWGIGNTLTKLLCYHCKVGRKKREGRNRRRLGEGKKRREE